MTAEQLYIHIGKQLPETTFSQMFGKPCLKANTKAFGCFFQDAMVFKLSGDNHKKAIG